MKSEKFGRLTVIRKTDRKQRREFLYECLCDCGNTAYRTRQVLNSGHARSCGCLQRDTVRKAASNLIVDGTKPSAFTDKPNKNNKTGLKGVSIYEQSGRIKYKASLFFKGKNYHKKGFETAEEAKEYRLFLEEKYLKNIKK